MSDNLQFPNEPRMPTKPLTFDDRGLRMYPDKGLKQPVRSFEEVSRESWDHIRSLFGMPPKREPFLPDIIK